MNAYIKSERSDSDQQPYSFRRGNMILVLATIAMLLAMLLGTAGAADAESLSLSQPESHPAEITASVSKSVMRVAEPIELELTVTAPANTQVYFPSTGDRLGDLDVVDQQDIFDIPIANSEDRRSWTRRLKLESIKTGELEIPSVEVQTRTGSTLTSIKSASIPVRVTSVLEDRADPTQFRDIQSVVNVEIPQSTTNTGAWWLAGGLGIVATVLAIVGMVATRQKHLTPAQWANNELVALMNSDATKRGDAESVLRDTSTILRDYLQLQFEIAAPVQTTRELMQLAKSGKFFDTQIAMQFGNLFAMADQAKFAGLQLNKETLECYIEAARSLVKMTANVPVDRQAESTDCISPNQSKPAENQ